MRDRIRSLKDDMKAMKLLSILVVLLGATGAVSALGFGSQDATTGEQSQDVSGDSSKQDPDPDAEPEVAAELEPLLDLEQLAALLDAPRQRVNQERNQASMMRSMKRAPGVDGRVARLVELLKQRGAEEDALEITAVPPPDEKWLGFLQSQYRVALREYGLAPLDIDQVVAVEVARLQADLGQNVLLRVPGKTDRVLIVGASLDVPPGGSGVINDWSACVVLAHLYEAIAAAELDHSVWFAAFGASHAGAMGATAMANAMTPEQAERVDAFIHLDTLGMTGPAVWIEMSGALTGIIERCAHELEVPLAEHSLTDGDRRGGDLGAFRGLKIPTAWIHGVDWARTDLLRGEQETVELIDEVGLEQTQRLVHGLLLVLDRLQKPVDRATYRELFPSTDADFGYDVKIIQALGLTGPWVAGTPLPALPGAVPEVETPEVEKKADQDDESGKESHDSRTPS